MARGQRKPIEDKIREKQEVIAELESKLQKEKVALKTLLQEKKEQDVDSLYKFISESDISVDEAKEIIQKNISEN